MEGKGAAIDSPSSYGGECALAGVCGTRRGLAHAYGTPNTGP